MALEEETINSAFPLDVRAAPGLHLQAPGGGHEEPHDGRAGKEPPVAVRQRAEPGGARPRREPADVQGLQRQDQAEGSDEDGEGRGRV